MKATPEWVHEPDAAELLHIKACTLRNMRRERRLDAGTHWVYTTGSIGGPVVYNIPEIRKMQRQHTIEAAQIKDTRQKTEQEYSYSLHRVVMPTVFSRHFISA